MTKEAYCKQSEAASFSRRLKSIVDFSFESFCQKVNGQRIKIDNEASMQLHLANILKSTGELFEYQKEEVFSIELEKAVASPEGHFSKSKSKNAKIDIFLRFENITTNEVADSAIELKFFKRANAREPKNRYDLFSDLKNLEQYSHVKDCNFVHKFMIVATDHDHYVNKSSYSSNTKDFDFRQGSEYTANTTLKYETPNPHGPDITLENSYKFNWRMVSSSNKIHFLILEVQ